MRVAFGAAAIFLSIALGSQALAATVNTMSGQVLINRGEGYRLVAGSAQGDVGDTVVANPGGSAQIVYPDGCVVEVLPGAVTTIAAQSPCTASGGTGANATTYAIGAVVVGGGVAAAIFLQKDKSASP